ncbi:unnamed protein product [Eruca vesicaria subsp. sativa]|uniref:DUF4220 domain-containing protein n=1 Tax=Eruca vesicaria subsp. sativa TaxID=29727 RepID=A0ABC8JL21_ERUVS|nr:unnamed protein product [Eruca vesicaria subsp. sativa]
MAEVIQEAVTDMWGKWTIRGLVISSLALQATLVVLSPNRKRTRRIPFQFLIWSAYLLANWSADYAVGQISDSSGDKPEANESPKTNELLAFWAMFLLLHLGGPDTITALAMEDNELWLRSLFGLACQFIATLYVFLLSIPTSLFVPTSLMLVAGVIKYFERIIAMRGATLERFKDSMLEAPEPGIDYTRFMEEYKTRKILKERSQLVRVPEAKKEKGVKESGRSESKRKCMTHLEAVQHAYKYFNIYKGLVVDFIYSYQQWIESKQFFQLLSAEDALRILEVELSFLYGTLFTKIDILHNWIGVLFRCIALGCLFTSLHIFKASKKDGYDGFDVGLTYVLIFGGIILDSISILIFCLSDWAFARLSSRPKEELDTSFEKILNWLLSFRELKWKKCQCHKQEKLCHSVLDRLFIFRRWSEHIYAYSLISSSLKIKPETIHHTRAYIHNSFDAIIRSSYIDRLVHRAFKALNGLHEKIHIYIISLSNNHRVICWMMDNLFYPTRLALRLWSYIFEFYGISDLLNVILYTSHERLTQEIWEFIFEEVKRRSVFVVGMESASQIYSARGDWVLRDMKVEIDNEKLLQYVTDLDYDQSILVWHIATELLHQTTDVPCAERDARWKELSKTLSEYMMYLLIAKPYLMSTVAGIDKVRFKDAAAEVKNLRKTINQFQKKDVEDLGDAKTACQKIMSVVKQSDETAKGYGSKSVLLRASMLARDLRDIQVKVSNDKMWEVMSKVWVEMLCYAATHCDSKQHAAQLNRGGELINFVWLLMAHFGLGEQFRTTKEDSRAKLILDKTTTFCLV